MSEKEIFVNVVILLLWTVFGGLFSWHLNDHAHCEGNPRKTVVTIFLCGPVTGSIIIIVIFLGFVYPALTKLNKIILKYWEKL